jgi:mono/diheme cytochrome c family protein
LILEFGADSSGAQAAMRLHSTRLIIAIGAALVGQVQAGLAADSAHGEQLARRWCATCHVVGLEERRTLADLPTPFASVAARPDFDVNRLAFFLLDPHPVMPNMSLTRAEASDLAAYIASLRK